MSQPYVSTLPADQTEGLNVALDQGGPPKALQREDGATFSRIPETVAFGKYRFVESNAFFAIYDAGKSYEIVRIRFYSSNHCLCPGRFRYPATSEWGIHAWSSKTLDFARRILEQESRNIRARRKRKGRKPSCS